MTTDKRVEEIAERITTTMDGRTVTSHEHYREMLKKELVHEIKKHTQSIMNELVEELQGMKKVIPKIAGTQYEGEICYNDAITEAQNIIRAKLNN